MIFEVRYAVWYNKSGSQYSYGFNFPLPMYPLVLLKVALDYAIGRVQVKVKLNGTHQLWFMLTMLIYWEEVYIL